RHPALPGLSGCRSTLGIVRRVGIPAISLARLISRLLAALLLLTLPLAGLRLLALARHVFEHVHHGSTCLASALLLLPLARGFQDLLDDLGLGGDGPTTRVILRQEVRGF